MLKVKIKVNGEEKVINCKNIDIFSFSNGMAVERVYCENGDLYACIYKIGSDEYDLDLTCESLRLVSPVELSDEITSIING